MTGTIKKLLPEKAYGFILGSDNKEYFFHIERHSAEVPV